MDIKQKGNSMSFTIQQIEQYAASKRFREGLAIPSEKSIKFSMLGQGEYNINYLFRSARQSRVLATLWWCAWSAALC